MKKRDTNKVVAEKHKLKNLKLLELNMNATKRNFGKRKLQDSYLKSGVGELKMEKREL